MLKDIVFYTFVSIGIVETVHFALYIVGANIYDMMQFRRRAKVKRNPEPARKGHQPLVSVVIAAHNEALNITRTLDSILSSKYQNIEIIVVNDDSSDNTAEVVRNYIKKLPASVTRGYMARNPRNASLKRRYLRSPQEFSPITLVNQARTGKGGAINNGVKNYAKGTFVMTLDGDSLIDPNAVTNAVARFKDPKVVGVAANVRVIDSRSMLSVLQKFEHMIGYRSKKFYTLSNSELIVGGVASTYRRSVLKKVGFYDTDTQTEDIGLSMKIVALLGNKGARIVYAADVVAYTEGVQTYRALFKQRYRWKLGMLQNLVKYRRILGSNDSRYNRMIAFYRMPLAFISELILLIEPMLLVYIVYLSVKFQRPSALLGAYATITLYVLWTLWPDEHTSTRNKIRLSFLAPAMYFVFYVMNVVQVVSILRCLWNIKKLTGRASTVGHWTSPERAAALQAQNA